MDDNSQVTPADPPEPGIVHRHQHNEKMEATVIPPLKKRWECKALIQYDKNQTIKSHLVHTRTTKISSRRLKRSSFIRETRQLQPLKKQYPTEVQVSPPPSHTDKLQNIIINTTVPYLTTKDKHSDQSRKALTFAMLDERYPPSPPRGLHKGINRRICH
jgi:hypothetical protein